MAGLLKIIFWNYIETKYYLYIMLLKMIHCDNILNIVYDGQEAD